MQGCHLCRRVSACDPKEKTRRIFRVGLLREESSNCLIRIAVHRAPWVHHGKASPETDCQRMLAVCPAAGTLQKRLAPWLQQLRIQIQIRLQSWLLEAAPLHTAQTSMRTNAPKQEKMAESTSISTCNAKWPVISEA